MGRSWSRPQTIDLAPPNGFDQSGEVLVLPGGALLIVLARIEVLPNGTFLNTMFATRSEDKGVTWSSPVTAAAQEVGPVADPENPETDGGISWSGPAPLTGVFAFSFEPAIAVDRRGTVGVIWYDHRGDRPGDVPLTTDVWFAHSRDRGGTWLQTHVAGPFDLPAAPSPTGFLRLGEYQALAGLRRGFAAISTQAAPQAKDGPTDIFFARIQQGDHDD